MSKGLVRFEELLGLGIRRVETPIVGDPRFVELPAVLGVVALDGLCERGPEAVP